MPRFDSPVTLYTLLKLGVNDLIDPFASIYVYFSLIFRYFIFNLCSYMTSIFDARNRCQILTFLWENKLRNRYHMNFFVKSKLISSSKIRYYIGLLRTNSLYSDILSFFLVNDCSESALKPDFNSLSIFKKFRYFWNYSSIVRGGWLWLQLFCTWSHAIGYRIVEYHVNQNPLTKTKIKNVQIEKISR